MIALRRFQPLQLQIAESVLAIQHVRDCKIWPRASRNSHFREYKRWFSYAIFFARIHLYKFMEKTLVLLLSFIFITTAKANEVFAIQAGESVAEFVTRIVPLPQTVKHGPIEYRGGMVQAPIIFAFLENPPSVDDATGATTLSAISLLPISSTTYEKVDIDSYESEGGNPEIESVFFSSIDKTLDKKLIVIVSWTQNHAIVKGKLFATYVYALPDKSNSKKFRYLKNISERLSGGCECWHADGTSTRSKFKSASDIRRVLRK